MKKNISAKKTIVYIGIFILLLGLTAWAVMKGQDPEKLMEVVKSTKGSYLAIAMVLSISFVFFEAVNLKRVLRVLNYKAPYIKCLRYAATGYFFSAITPSATGGQPMQVYAMSRDGVEISHGSIALLIELICFQAAVCLYGLVSIGLTLAGVIEVNKYVFTLAVVGCCLGVGMLIFLFAAIFTRGISLSLKTIIIEISAMLPVISQEKKIKFRHSIEEHFNEYDRCSKVMQKNMSVLPKIFGVTMAQFACQFTIAYMIYLALGQNTVSPALIFFMQALVYMATSYVPIPGAVGATEGVFLVVFGQIYTSTMGAGAMILGRGLSFYIPVVICGAVIVIWLLRTVTVARKNLDKIAVL